MGSVVLARQRSVDRLVAVKQLHVESSRSARSRLAREGRALAELDCSNVIRIYGVEPAGDDLYLILEYIDGPTLAAIIAAGDLSVPDALAIISQLATGLRFIHERGVVHRDVKPGNVLVSSEGVCKLNDFGLVRLLHVATGRPVPMTVLTREGMPIGTAAYMSPEAVVGDQTLDQRADLYALAMISYDLLLGRPPFPNSLDLLPMLNAQLNTPPPAPTSIDPTFPLSVEVAILRALQKDRNERYPTVAAYWDDLQAAASIAWPEWSSEADLKVLVAPDGVRITDTPGPPTIVVPLDDPSAPFPNEIVLPEMPKLKRRRRHLALLFSAFAGLAVALVIFEVFSRVIH